MAEAYLFINASDIAVVQKSLPNSVIPVRTGSVELIHYSDYQDETVLLGKITPSAEDETWKYNKITQCKLVCDALLKTAGAPEASRLYVRSLGSTYDPVTVTWNTAPKLVKPWKTKYDYVTVVDKSRYRRQTMPSNEVVYTDQSRFAYQVIKYGFAIFNDYITTVPQTSIEVQNGIGDVYVGTPSNAPYISIFIDDETIVTSQITASGKTSGYYLRNEAQTFSWRFDKAGAYYCFGDWTQASAVFHWRNGTSGAWNDVPASGSTQSVTIPANTFQLGTVQWYVSGVDNVGTASQSDVYTITTADADTIATPISPIGEVVDGSATADFTWGVSNDYGTLPTGADLQISTNGSTWQDLASVTGPVTVCAVPANTLPGGKVWWRVRAYNSDNIAGAWSDPVSFVSVAAPPAPIVSAAAVPFTTINWQSSGQQAYRITIDGVTYGPFFGTGKSYTPNEYLRDGDHTISVEIQGSYGLWSQPGIVTITVANAPGDGITLTGSFSRDAYLSWETESATADFLVYRDDKRIGVTSSPGFVDRFVLGSHSYQVINRLSDGNYTASNVVTGVMRSCTTAIAPFNGGAWQELTLSENSYSEQRFSWTKVSSLRHVTGAVYPVLEISEYENAAGSYDVSFPDVASANAFLALRGQIVILKSRGGNVVIGALTQIEQANKDFYISFAFTIQRIDWEDYVDAQNS